MSYEVIVEIRISNKTLDLANTIANRRNNAAKQLNALHHDLIAEYEWLEGWTDKEVIEAALDSNVSMESIARNLENVLRAELDKEDAR